jgi:hypothetical protein
VSFGFCVVGHCALTAVNIDWQKTGIVRRRELDTSGEIFKKICNIVQWLENPVEPGLAPWICVSVLGSVCFVAALSASQYWGIRRSWRSLSRQIRQNKHSWSFSIVTFSFISSASSVQATAQHLGKIWLFVRLILDCPWFTVYFN